jgi:threonine/homoserine/homoserine lactone efflux protein
MKKQQTRQEESHPTLPSSHISRLDYILPVLLHSIGYLGGCYLQWICWDLGTTRAVSRYMVESSTVQAAVFVDSLLAFFWGEASVSR